MIPQNLTPAGHAAHLDRGPCGHILCAYAVHCLLTQAPVEEES